MTSIRWIHEGTIQTASKPFEVETWTGMPGDTADVPSDIAKVLITGGYAEPTEGDAAPSAKTATKPRTQRRRA